jgi:drug/metabolite transporter (DMT)-like permease
LPLAILMGLVLGMFYMGSFLLLNISTARNGVVLSSVFMKLGLLVPMVVSIFLFGEIPSLLQALGFVIAIAAILLINSRPGQLPFRFNWLLLLLLLGGGSGDAMAKIYEAWGDPALASHFLLYTFLTALVLCLILMRCQHQRIGRMELAYGLLIGIPNFFSAKFLLASLNFLPAVIVYPTYSVATMLVVTLAGVLFFHEKLNRRQWLALVMILIALILLNL